MNQGLCRDSFQSLDRNPLSLPLFPHLRLRSPASPSSAPSLPRPGALRHSSTGSHRQRPPRGDVRGGGGGPASAPARRRSAWGPRPRLVAGGSHVAPAIKGRVCDAKAPRRAYWLCGLRAGSATRSLRRCSLHGRVWCPRRRRLQSRRRPATTTATPCPAAAATAAACVAAASGPAV